MNRNKFVIPECYVDTCLADVLLKDKSLVNHKKGNGTVAKTMKEDFPGDFCIGIIDEDRKRSIDYILEFKEVKITPHVKLMKHKELDHFMIQIRPVIEKWILTICQQSKINLDDFGLPGSIDNLMRISKSVTSREDVRFIGLFKRFLSIENETAMQLKKWVVLLKENKYKVDINQLKNV